MGPGWPVVCTCVAVGAGVHAFLAAFRVPRQRPVGPPDSFGLVYDGDHDARRVPAEPTETQGALIRAPLTTRSVEVMMRSPARR